MSLCPPRKLCQTRNTGPPAVEAARRKVFDPSVASFSARCHEAPSLFSTPNLPRVVSALAPENPQRVTSGSDRAAEDVARARSNLLRNRPRVTRSRSQKYAVCPIPIRHPGRGDCATGERGDCGLVVFELRRRKLLGASDPYHCRTAAKLNGRCILNIVEREIEIALLGLHRHTGRLPRVDCQEHADRHEQNFRLIARPHFRVMDIGEGRNFIPARGAFPDSRPGDVVVCRKVAAFGRYDRAAGDAGRTVPRFGGSCFQTESEQQSDIVGRGCRLRRGGTSIQKATG